MWKTNLKKKKKKHTTGRRADCKDFCSTSRVLSETLRKHFLFPLSNKVVKEQSKSPSTLYQPDSSYWPEVNLIKVPRMIWKNQKQKKSLGLLEILGK